MASLSLLETLKLKAVEEVFRTLTSSVVPAAKRKKFPRTAMVLPEIVPMVSMEPFL